MINSPLIKACSQERNDLTHYYKYVFVIFFFTTQPLRAAFMDMQTSSY